MEPSLTDVLCTRCGLCCDGSLFADVELAGRAEIERLEVLGLDVELDGARSGLMPLPCSALHGRRCSIYAHRPGTCRTFECRLLQQTRRGEVAVEAAQRTIVDTLAQVASVTALLERLAPTDAALPLRERCAEALAEDGDSTASERRTHTALETEMHALDERIRTRFLFDDARVSRRGPGRDA